MKSSASQGWDELACVDSEKSSYRHYGLRYSFAIVLTLCDTSALGTSLTKLAFGVWGRIQAFKVWPHTVSVKGWLQCPAFLIFADFCSIAFHSAHQWINSFILPCHSAASLDMGAPQERTHTHTSTGTAWRHDEITWNEYSSLVETLRPACSVCWSVCLDLYHFRFSSSELPSLGHWKADHPATVVLCVCVSLSENVSVR